MKAMAYNVTNGLSINKNKSVVQGKKSKYNPHPLLFLVYNHWSSKKAQISKRLAYKTNMMMNFFNFFVHF